MASLVRAMRPIASSVIHLERNTLTNIVQRRNYAGVDLSDVDWKKFDAKKFSTWPRHYIVLSVIGGWTSVILLGKLCFGGSKKKEPETESH
eukprot:TRINITY_DN1913_c0_g1::TRINITY_DN1913_c0_g1_i1::g.23133::m.23133 TRINITY_DN1913_c0_g1::TRINITY_DN1913_c0_g1_i1::g.23133  ORF type:complete len:103 (+),score=24.43 TRINITY_DN1913_c0_g1_i1:37-309(+)